MENILVAIVVIFVILFAVLTLSHAFISAQDTIQVAWQAMEANTNEMSGTHLTPVDAYTMNNGTKVMLAIQNDGDVRLADFSQWDVILQYFDNASPEAWHVDWMSYVKSTPSDGEWTIQNIYHVLDSNTEEAYDMGILDPGESVVLQLQVSPAIAPGTTAQAMVSTGKGIGGTMSLMGNYPPQLETNTGLTFPTGGTVTIEDTYLAASDEDDAPENLIYTVASAPQQGSLSLGSTFTQQDIDNGLLEYAHTGSGDDSFSFTISDNKDVIGTYTFTLTESEPPTLQNLQALVVNGNGVWQITQMYLLTSDPDDDADSLVYNVVVAPIQGTLNMSTFTQQDIDNGLLEYTHTGINNDAFQFTITDGETVIGPLIFVITG